MKYVKLYESYLPSRKITKFIQELEYSLDGLCKDFSSSVTDSIVSVVAYDLFNTYDDGSPVDILNIKIYKFGNLLISAGTIITHDSEDWLVINKELTINDIDKVIELIKNAIDETD